MTAVVRKYYFLRRLVTVVLPAQSARLMPMIVAFRELVVERPGILVGCSGTPVRASAGYTFVMAEDCLADV